MQLPFGKKREKFRRHNASAERGSRSTMGDFFMTIVSIGFWHEDKIRTVLFSRKEASHEPKIGEKRTCCTDRFNVGTYF